MGGQGIYPQACDEKTHRKPLRARLSYTFLKRHQGARSEARAGAPVGAKEVYSVPARVPCRSEGSVQRASRIHIKTLEECSTHYTVVLT